MLMGVDIYKIMYVGTDNTDSFVFMYKNGRTATMAQLGWECDFGMAINYIDNHTIVTQGAADFFLRFIKQLVGFFRDGKPRVSPEETLQVMTVLEYGEKAKANPGTWIEVPEIK